MPNSTSDQELQHVRNCLPDDVVVQRVDERLSALGNTIACNDYVSLIHPDLDRVGVEILLLCQPAAQLRPSACKMSVTEC